MSTVVTPLPSARGLDPAPKPTVTFLSTLLSTPEPKDPDLDLEVQESRFLDPDDWGPQRTSEEMQHLQNCCRRLQYSLSTNQEHNLVLAKKLKTLPTSLYQRLKTSTLAILEEAKARDMEEEAEFSQEEAEASLVGQMESALIQMLRHTDPTQYSCLRSLMSLPGATLLPEGSAACPTARLAQGPQELC